MYPFSIIRKIEIDPNRKTDYEKAIMGNLSGRTIKKTKPNEFVIEKKKHFNLSIYDNNVELKFQDNELIIKATNEWSIALSIIGSIIMIIQVIVEFITKGKFKIEPLLFIPVIWIFLSTILLYNYLFIISTIRDIKTRIDDITSA